MKEILLRLIDTSYNDLKEKAERDDYKDVGKWICHNLQHLVNKCQAMTVRGVRCESQAALQGYCMRHYHKKTKVKKNE